MRRSDSYSPEPSRGSHGKGRKPVGKATEPVQDPGPRPVSARQHQLRALMRGEPLPPPARETPPVPDTTGSSRAEARLLHLRDAGASRRRVLKVKNRRRPNYKAIGIACIIVGLFLTGFGALFSHPYFAIRRTVVAGNSAVPTEKIRAVFEPLIGKNLFLASLDKFQVALLKSDPTLKTVTVRHLYPNGVQVRVLEREPWASVMLPDGTCYTIDRELIPFRKAETPEPELPRVLLSEPGQGKVAPVELGKLMQVPGLESVQTCLTWAGEQDNFTLESVTIDPDGKLCLNRKGGVQVRLGSERELERKLAALNLLMERRVDLKTGTQAQFVNLYAPDAPAVMPRNLSNRVRADGT